MAKISKATQARARSSEKAAVKVARKVADASGGTPGTMFTNDAYQNFAQAIGIGTNNALSGSTYGFNPITRIRTLLDWIYRGSWLGGVAVDIIADDMTRAGIEIQSTAKPEDIERLQQALVRHGVWTGINETIKWSRLYGGALALILIDGQDVSTPLNIDRVGKEAFRGLLVFDRWMLEPDLNDLVTDLGPELGLPKFYRVNSDAPAFRLKKLHHSRCIRMEGIRLPYWQRVMENMWGLSVFERLYDRMVGFDSATMGMAQLVYKAYIRTFKLKGLRKLIGEGGDALRALMQWVEMTRKLQGNEGITIIDGDDEFQPNQQTSFAGIGDAVLQLGQQIAGALEVPLTRMFGQAPAGLNATGESDERNYQDGINHKQEMTMRFGVHKIVFVCAKSEGVKLGDRDTFTFRHLGQMTEAQRSEIFDRDSRAIKELETGGIIGLQTALKELRGLSRITGRMTNITDKAIEDASDEPAPSAGELGLMGPGGAGGPDAPGEVDDPGMSLKPGDNDNEGEKGRRRAANDLATAPIYADLPVVVEARRGSRRWPGANPLLADYGYIAGVSSNEGAQEWMDCFLGQHQQGERIYIIDMQRPDGTFEEHKVMLGFDQPGDAAGAFTQLYGVERAMGMVQMTVPELHAWLDAKDFKAPLSRAS